MVVISVFQIQRVPDELSRPANYKPGVLTDWKAEQLAMVVGILCEHYPYLSRCDSCGLFAASRHWRTQGRVRFDCSTVRGLESWMSRTNNQGRGPLRPS